MNIPKVIDGRIHINQINLEKFMMLKVGICSHFYDKEIRDIHQSEKHEFSFIDQGGDQVLMIFCKECFILSEKDETIPMRWINGQ